MRPWKFIEGAQWIMGIYIYTFVTHILNKWEEIVSNFVTVKIGAWSTHLSPNDTFKASFRRLCSEAITYYLWWNDGWTFYQKYDFVQILIHNLFTQKSNEYESRVSIHFHYFKMYRIKVITVTHLFAKYCLWFVSITILAQCLIQRRNRFFQFFSFLLILEHRIMNTALFTKIFLSHENEKANLCRRVCILWKEVNTDVRNVSPRTWNVIPDFC